MGNKKNQKNKKYSMHKSRRAYVKKKLPTKKFVEKKVGLGSTGEEANSPPGMVAQGSRVINVGNMLEYVDKVARHASSCDGSVEVSRESRSGLASVFTGECCTCDQTVTLETSKKVKGLKGYHR